MIDSLRAQTAKLKAATIDALKKADEIRRADTQCALASEAVNWAQLLCEGVYYTVYEDEAWDHWVVVVSEASPEAYEFVAFIEADLSAQGWGDVEVRTEW